MLFLLVILLILGLVFPRSRILFLCQGIFIFFLIGLRVHDPDHYVYQVEYLSAPSIYYKFADFPGWNLWMNFFIDRGIAFNSFLLVMAVICVGLMSFGIYKIGKHLGEYISFALSVFLVYPLGHEATQMRTFFADALILVVLPFLLSDEGNTKKKWLGYAMYFVVVYIATSIHTLAYFFLLVGIIFIYLKSFRYEFQSIVIISFIMSVLANSYLLSSFIGEFLNTGKQSHWLTNSGFSAGKMIPIIITIFIWLIAYLEINELRENCDNLNINKQYLINTQRFMNTIFLLIPLLSYDITFNRLWRVYLLLEYLITGLYLYGLKDKNSYKKVLVSGLFFFIVIIIYCYENEITITGKLF